MKTNCSLPLTALLLLLPAGSLLGDLLTAARTTNSPSALFDERVDVGGHKLRIVIYGQGAPTVIIEAGGGQAVVENGSWNPTITEIAKTTRICIYDRAGLGSSDSVPAKTRTAEDMVKDLHTLLVAAKVPGPYILVGHSTGGYNARVFAKRYPKEVAGMVLVESSHPDQWSKLLAILPPESPEETANIKGARKSLVNETADPSANPERIDVAASATQAGATGGLGDLPLVVLTRSPNFYTRGGKAQQLLEPVWQNLQVDLCNLSSNSTHVVATKAGHFLQVDEPQLVIDAILKVVDAARKRR